VSQDQLPFDEPAPAAPTKGADFTVQVVRSKKRKRTVGAQLRGGVLTITIPSWMSKAEEASWTAEMVGRFRRKSVAERVDLRQRAATLARRYDLPMARDIKWSDDMTSRWGSCTPTLGTVRLSTRLGPFPDWVIDYVIVHELAHIEVAAHDEAFWRLVARYPKSERAIGYLIAKSGDEDVD